MHGFEDVTLGWDGKEYTIPASQQLMLIAKLEDVLGGASGRQAVEVLTQASGPSYAVLSMAYGTALRHAGAQVTDDEIYLGIIEGFTSGRSDMAEVVQKAILNMLAIIAPPLARMLRADDDEVEPLKPLKKKKAAA